MPIYEYRCDECGERFEKIQSFSASNPACPACTGGTQKLVSAPAIRFKGEGWYVNDYAGKSNDSAGDCSKEAKASCSQPACAQSAD